MFEGGQPEKPAILILSAGAAVTEREVLAGIEEEGVPALLEAPADDADAGTLARRAAGRSSLSVGVGIDSGGRICVQHQKLVEQLPGLASSGAADPVVARTLGHDAARIVVGIPLRMDQTP